MQASRSENIKQLAKNQKGMFIVRWKKGLESLNLKEDKTTSEEENENNSEEGTKEEARVILTQALRNKGYGKY